jgi:hypothetical protein
MTREKYNEITMHLDNVHDLFTTPAGDPFSAKANFVSGIELIKSELKSRSWGLEERTRTTIFLPKESIEPNLAEKTKDALQRYCQFKVRQNKHATAELRQAALMALLVGVLFLVGRLYLSPFLERVASLPPFLSAFISNGFDIAFWVILWRPVDFFLFELWPSWREDRIYKNIMKMEIMVSEEH